MNMQATHEKTKNILVDNTINTIAASAAINPIFGAFETFISGPDASLDARMYGMGFGLLGGTYLFVKGRNLAKEKLNVGESEIKQVLHDAPYSAVFNAIPAPFIYHFLAGINDWKQVAALTICTAAVSAVSGIPTGYAIDTFRDMCGLEECNRSSYPSLVKKQSPTIKKTIAAGIVGLSLGSLAAIYGLMPQKNHMPKQESRLEQTITQDTSTKPF